MIKLYRSKRGEQALLASYDRLLGQWGVPVEERDIPTRYGTTHVLIAGDAALPPLVLFHGVGDDAALMWVYNAAELSQHFRLYALDTMGGPGKSRPNAQYGKGFLQECWIDDTLDGLGLGTVLVAGTSNGAYLAQRYAARRPQRVRRCVSMAGGLAAGVGSPMGKMMRVFLPEALLPTKRNVGKLLAKMIGENIAVFTGNEALMEHWTLLLRHFNNMAMGFHRIAPLNAEEVAALRGKTLFLLGDRDPLAYSAACVETLEREGMEYHVYPGVGHGVNHERATEVNGELIDFFKKP